MPASKKNKENLKKAIDQAYKETNSSEGVKRIAQQIRTSTQTEKKPVKKSREYNKAVAQRELAKLRDQKKR
jgi:hypothetical protein